MSTSASTASERQREFALKVVERLRAAGHEALWAGGCVRDQLLGRAPKDYDVATSARPDAVQELFGRGRTRAIGAAFGVISVLGRKPLEPIEVATFRTDGDYRDGRRPESVEFTDAEHDAQRRDFTINGLFYDPLDERVVDFVGGVADIDSRVVRAIGDPRLRFAEDKLRMLRAVRFAATYEFAIALDTLAAIREMADETLQVSAERIGAELRRILMSPHRRRGVELLVAADLVRPIFPELAPHASASDAAWQASLDRLDRLRNVEFPAALAAWVLGMLDAPMVRELGRRLRLSNKELDRAAWLVAHVPDVAGAKSVPWPRLQRLLAHEAGRELVALAAAELPEGDQRVEYCLAQLARPTDEWNPPPLVTGDDLIAAGLPPGRHFNELLERLRDEQLEGRLRTREEALDAARRWHASDG